MSIAETSEGPEVDAKFPKAFAPLFKPCRYKIFHGGRGGAKSWNFARALLILGAEKPLRILCAREFQTSIDDSVHRLLSDQVQALGLQGFYEIQKTQIIGANGTLIVFEGLRRNIGNLKSFEGCDICWVEEATDVSKASWEILIPTIRKEASEIWISFNPELETDETFLRFVRSPPKESCVVKVNWEDNPWFPDVLRHEMEDLKARDYDSYLTVWEGHCRQSLDGAVYAKEIREATAANRITKVPYESAKPVHTFWDLGKSDNTAIWFVQVVGFEFRVIDYYQNHGHNLSHYIKTLGERPYAYGTMWLPHDATHDLLASERTIEQQMRGFGFNVRITPKTSVATGIEAARTIFSKCWFDADKTADGLQCLRHYRYDRKQDGMSFSKEPVHDWASHGCLTGDSLVETIGGLKRIDKVEIGDRVWTPAGYAKVTAAGPVKQAEELLTIETRDGILRCTPEHKIFTNRGLVTADELRYGDEVITGNEPQCDQVLLYSKATNIGYREATTAVINGARWDRQIYTEQSGKTHTVRYQMGTKYTTLMGMCLTTASKIYSAFTGLTINAIIHLSDIAKVFLSRRAKRLSYAQQSGIDQKMAWLGTQRPERGLGTSAFGMNETATNAHGRTKHRIQSGPNSVTSIARWRHSDEGGDCPLVYDLTVEKHHCYKANGLLVSNSDAWRYMAVALQEEKPLKKQANQRGPQGQGAWLGA